MIKDYDIDIIYEQFMLDQGYEVLVNEEVINEGLRNVLSGLKRNINNAILNNDYITAKSKNKNKASQAQDRLDIYHQSILDLAKNGSVSIGGKLFELPENVRKNDKRIQDYINNGDDDGLIEYIKSQKWFNKGFGYFLKTFINPDKYYTDKTESMNDNILNRSGSIYDESKSKLSKAQQYLNNQQAQQAKTDELFSSIESLKSSQSILKQVLDGSIDPKRAITLFNAEIGQISAKKGYNKRTKAGKESINSDQDINKIKEYISYMNQLMSNPDDKIALKSIKKIANNQDLQIQSIQRQLRKTPHTSDVDYENRAQDELDFIRSNQGASAKDYYYHTNLRKNSGIEQVKETLSLIDDAVSMLDQTDPNDINAINNLKETIEDYITELNEYENKLNLAAQNNPNMASKIQVIQAEIKAAKKKINTKLRAIGKKNNRSNPQNPANTRQQQANPQNPTNTQQQQQVNQGATNNTASNVGQSLRNIAIQLDSDIRNIENSVNQLQQQQSYTKKDISALNKSYNAALTTLNTTNFNNKTKSTYRFSTRLTNIKTAINGFRSALQQQRANPQNPANTRQQQNTTVVPGSRQPLNISGFQDFWNTATGSTP